MSSGASTDLELLNASASGRAAVLGTLIEQHRERLVRMVRVRLHPQVRQRVDASDVIQEACLEAHRRIDDYVADPRIPFFLWLRRIVGDRLLKAHRAHLDVQQRDVRRQIRGGGEDMPDVSVAALVDMLAASNTSPTRGVARAELRDRVGLLLADLADTDREVLCMRHFEELSNEEVAEELGLGKHAASKRYIRALQRLRGMVGSEPTVG